DALLVLLGLSDRRPMPRVDRPAGADVQRPRRVRRDLLDEVAHAGHADVERGEEAEALLPRQEARAERDLAGRDRIVGEAVVAADVARLAEISLPIDRDENVVFY